MTLYPRIEAILDAMTLDEQVRLLSGEDFWSVAPQPAHGIGRLRVTDGPNGARGRGSLIGGVKATAFPVGIALGATFDPDLVTRIGAALAQEVRDKGAHVLLAPTVNIHRSVTNGRNFECYSEDPVLTARLAVAYIRGLQGEGIGATIKHFVGNESEIERTTISSLIDERVLREIYLIPFEAAVKEAGTWAIMSSYNKLNGTYTAENAWLLDKVLRADWGYDGIVMSDWFGSRSTAPTVLAGLDLEMPGPTRDRGERLVAAVTAGEVPAEAVRARARAMLGLLARAGLLDGAPDRDEVAVLRPEVRALIRTAGAAAAVLLKNDGLLPLDPATCGRVAVIGPNAKVAQIMGGGSAQLNAHLAVSPWDGLAEALGADRLTHAAGATNHRYEPLLRGAFRQSFFANRDFAGAPVLVEEIAATEAFFVPPLAGGAVDPAEFGVRIEGVFVPEASGTHRIGLAVAGWGRVWLDDRLVVDAWDATWRPGTTFFEEGCDEVVAEVELTAGHAHQIRFEMVSRPARNLVFSAYRLGIGRPMGQAEIEAAAKVAAEADTVILCVGRNAEWDSEGADLPGIALPGLQDALVAAVLAANPRTVVVLQTGGPVEIPWVEAAPAILQAWYPGQEAGHALADVLLGRAEPGGRLPQTFPRRWSDNPTWSQDAQIYPGLAGEVRYEEGLFIGHRHYDRLGIAPLFPFGHGLGYTRFDLTALEVTPDGAGGAVAQVRLRNAGAREGTAVVQIYVSDPGAPVPRPVREFKGLARVTLAPGAEVLAEIALPPRAFAWFDTAATSWRVSGGSYGVQAGLSSGDLPLSGSVTLPAADLPV